MNLEISRIRALCFDVDGTLSDTDDQFVRKLVKWLHPVRFAFREGNPLSFARRFVMTTETPANFIFGLPDRLNVDGLFHHIGNGLYRLGMGKSSQPFLAVPGMVEALENLHQHFVMCVVSARDQRSMQRFLDQFEITPLFHCIATAHTCRHTKPFPDPILWAAQQMGVLPTECLMIGDTTVDIQAGKAAGAQTVGVLSGFGEQAELQQCQADLILPSVAELPKLLRPSSQQTPSGSSQ
jgi:phosphoglycolate phosphatase-like HAD superfamily hydrolase